VIEPELGGTDDGSSPASITFEAMAMHNMDPVRVLQVARALGGNIRQVTRGAGYVSPSWSPNLGSR
jgi:hypothetical protein